MPTSLDANLSGADFSDADLSYADLRYADLRYAVLSGADLSAVNLSGAQMTCLQFGCPSSLPPGYICEPDPGCGEPDRYRIVPRLTHRPPDGLNEARPVLAIV